MGSASSAWNVIRGEANGGHSTTAIANLLTLPQVLLVHNVVSLS